MSQSTWFGTRVIFVSACVCVGGEVVVENEVRAKWPCLWVSSDVVYIFMCIFKSEWVSYAFCARVDMNMRLFVFVDLSGYLSACIYTLIYSYICLFIGSFNYFCLSIYRFAVVLEYLFQCITDDKLLPLQQSLSPHTWRNPREGQEPCSLAPALSQ